MKNLILITLVCLAVAACGKDEPAPVVNEEPDATDEPVIEEPAPVAESMETEAVVVEESAAVPEKDEQEILLAQAETPAPVHDWQFSEGKHYKRLVPAQPTLGGADKIEVAEVFWYGCPHCYTFEPTINSWAAEQPANVRFVRIPAMWNSLLVLHARLFYTEQSLVRNEVIKDAAGFRNAVFEEYHRRGNRMASEEAIQRLFERFGVSAEQFTSTWNSFEVDQNLRKAADLNRRYEIASVPAIVVNGKYLTGGQEVGSNDRWLELVDELVLRESLR
jgi:thiol:disulfide interchange protein DsbA